MTLTRECHPRLDQLVHSGLQQIEKETHLISAIIVTGGNDQLDQVEVLLSDGTPWCTLPSLPEPRFEHSQSGLVACGGESTSSSCVTFSGGQWNTSHSLSSSRMFHSSWTSAKHGTILMGGGYSSSSLTSTEMLTDSGNSQESFELKYETM